MATYTNPKNQDKLETSLTMAGALAILEPKLADPKFPASSKAFASSLVGAAKSGQLRGGQVYWFYKLAEDNKPGKIDNRSMAIGENFARIHRMFQMAKASGLTRPKLYLQDSLANKITLSLAPDAGNNKGFIYVKREGEYCGKISPEGMFNAVSNCPEGIKTYLKEFAEDPLRVAQRYGRETGRCCCCGRELTNKESIALSVGPVCREKWGM